MNKNNLEDPYDACCLGCREKDIKTLEQRIDDLQRELAVKSNVIINLQCASAIPRGEALDTLAHGTKDDLPKPRRRDSQRPAAFHLSEDPTAVLTRERDCKLTAENSQLNERINKFQDEQKQFKSIIEQQEQELRMLRKQLDVGLYRHDQQQCHHPDVKVNRKMADPFSLKAGPSAKTDHLTNEEELEMFFQQICQQFKQLSTLTTKQAELLGKSKYSNNTIDLDFSIPIQCTDEGAHEQAEGPCIGKEGKKVCKGPSTAQGSGVYQNQLPVVQSLSELNIKFPPSDGDYEFLNSAAEKPQTKPAFEGPGDTVEKAVLKDTVQDMACKKFNKPECTSLETSPEEPTTEAAQNAFCDEQKPSTNFTVLTYVKDDNSPFRNPAGPAHKPFRNIEESHKVFQSSPTEIRGPQKTLWTPHHNKDGILPQGAGNSDLESNSKICEFCHKVFPAGTKSKEDFLRHLNSHFKDGAKNGF
uniref:UBZ1-type domain-containing protein n=1 Tax=Callorhinchus milii TaxID=7868 RepID=A0A4W3HBC0_CALMI|eukprot:gi/632945399/ref/XP_007888043.1/ PREDICTED: TRAF family member-associated NF-kappa-B activator [Callorhinchus milii]